MNALMTQEAFVAPQQNVESLAAGYYDRMYAFFNAFHDDPALCLELVDHTFRDAEACNLTPMCIFSKAVARLSRRPGLTLPVWTSSYESNLAWLLKDIAGLRYAEIGQILEMSHTEVKERIAEVRFTVLEHLAA